MTDALNVEWWHIGESVDATCERCSSTVRPLKEVFWEIRPIFSARRIRIRVREMVPFHEKIGESNTLSFNRFLSVIFSTRCGSKRDPSPSAHS
jgi:hypothetical protein